ncbi:Golgin candidate like [Actinidia chinensis var. chinensis]|uniref:Golgin candidate like n=1 Tax=Actinidia chinensis var. chinensis TaxID=1590841 RepID=A0A2R6R9K3_ACTCC|nr:Golgin candidate like [Actinidia chinensis var. chinensis]
MMWSSIANLKENLHKIALDVHDDDDETLEIYNSPDRNGASDRRISHNFARSSPASHSTLANGFDSPYNSEIEQYKAEIKRLQESESEIKALSLNYAALLKEKEDWIFRLNEENGLLKQNLEVTNASRNESFKTSANSLNGLKGGGDQSPNRQHKASIKSRSVGNRTNNGFISKHDGLSNGIAQSVQPDVSQTKMEKRSDMRVTVLMQNVQSLGSFPGKEEMELSMQKLEKDLKETRQQRDKASQELNRLKKHLLDKESEESEKMDEDNKIIEELREKNEYQRLQIQQLQKALKQSIASQDEVKMANNSELQKYKEIVEDLNRKLSSYRSMIDAKNVELLNLQTALGQYYAEIEAKEHLEGDLAHAREESTKLAELLKDAHQQGEITRKEKEDSLEKLSQADRTLAEGRNRVNKLEEDNAKLRRALEQNMSRINRMSVDSDFLVDRRIVIKLLVTYFQRNHSKEVLDLMVRMLGFSDEDKQRIGGAQQGTGKGVVRGVLGLPGRLVGGILGGGSAEANANTASENQSFADLWVDFLLKETEKRESAEAINASNGDQQNTSLNDTAVASPIPNQRTNSAGSPASRLSPSPYQYNSPLLLRGNILQPEHLDSEFSTVPLTSSERITSQVLRPLPRY